MLSETKVILLQWLKVTNQNHSYYKNSEQYQSNYEPSINKINLQESLQGNNGGKLQGNKDICLLELEGGQLLVKS